MSLINYDIYREWELGKEAAKVTIWNLKTLTSEFSNEVQSSGHVGTQKRIPSLFVEEHSL